MALPPTAKLFDEPLDPRDVEKYEITISQEGVDADEDFPILAPGEGVASFLLETTAEAAFAGLQIMTGMSNGQSYDPVLIGNRIIFHLTVDPAHRQDPIYDGGVELGLENTVTTNAAPARIKQKTVKVLVVQQ